MGDKPIRELSQPEKEVLAKGLTFAISLEQILVLDLISVTVYHQKQQPDRI